MYLHYFSSTHIQFQQQQSQFQSFLQSAMLPKKRKRKPTKSPSSKSVCPSNGEVLECAQPVLLPTLHPQESKSSQEATSKEPEERKKKGKPVILTLVQEDDMVECVSSTRSLLVIRTLSWRIAAL